MSNQNECIDSTPSKRPFRPVVIVHGLMTGDTSTMEHLAARIVEVSDSYYLLDTIDICLGMVY